MKLFRFALLFLIFSPCMAEPLKVVSSIRPLALIADDLLQQAALSEAVSVKVLLPKSASPHHFALRVSDKSAIQSADLVVWVGPKLEGFLAKAAGENSLRLMALEGIHWPHAVDHHHGGKDPHLWLDPKNAAVIARQLSAWFQQRLPQHRRALEAAEKAFLLSLQNLEQSSANKFSQGNVGLAVYHDGFGHLFEPLGVKQLASLTEVPEQQLGVQTLLKLKKGPQPACLIADTAELSMAEGFANKLNWRIQVVDLMAAEAHSYAEYYQGFLDALERCFQKE